MSVVTCRGFADAVCIVAASLASFSSLLTDDASFLNYDDEDNYVNNAFVQQCSVANVRWMLSDGVVLGVWEPAALLFKMVHACTIGLSAQAIRRTSFVLHTVNMLLACKVVTALLDAGRPAATPDHRQRRAACIVIAVALMGMHPLRAETVAWTSCLPYLLALLATQLCILCHPKTPELNLGARLASACFFVVAVLCKAPAISTAAVLVLLDVVAGIRRSDPDPDTTHVLLPPVDHSVGR